MWYDSKIKWNKTMEKKETNWILFLSELHHTPQSSSGKWLENSETFWKCSHIFSWHIFWTNFEGEISPVPPFPLVIFPSTNFYLKNCFFFIFGPHLLVLSCRMSPWTPLSVIFCVKNAIFRCPPPLKFKK